MKNAGEKWGEEGEGDSPGNSEAGCTWGAIMQECYVIYKYVLLHCISNAGRTFHVIIVTCTISYKYIIIYNL